MFAGLTSATKIKTSRETSSALVLLLPKPLKACRGQLRQFREQAFVYRSEVEARFTLHAFFETVGYVLKQVGEHINGHEMVADVVFSELHGGGEGTRRGFSGDGSGGIQVIIVWRIGGHDKRWHMGPKDFFQFLEDVWEFVAVGHDNAPFALRAR